jgi:group I intron endonuclease
MSKKVIVGIYGLRCKTTNKWYVGQSNDILSRWNRDYAKLNCKGQRKLYYALLKYGYADFEKVIIEECEQVDWILDYREMFWIRLLRCIENGYNLKEGGRSGGKCSEETRQKMSDAKDGLFFGENNPFYGKTHTEEVRKRLSDIAKIRHPSEETKRKIGLKSRGRPSPMKGRHHTEVAKQKIRVSSTGRKHSEEAKAKISLAKQNVSEETRQKLSLASIGRKPWLGRTHSEETKAKMSLSGKNKSPETIQRMREAAKLRWANKRLISC